MSVHEQFLTFAGVSFAVTVMALVIAASRGLAVRGRPLAYFLVGYGLIAAAFVIDSIFAPPLFMHGFIPGVGVGLVADALLLVALSSPVGLAVDPNLLRRSLMVMLFGLCALVAVALSVAVALAHPPANPSLRFAQGLAVGSAVGALVGLLGQLVPSKER